MKRPAHKICIPRFSSGDLGSTALPARVQHEEAWVPPGEPEIRDRDHVIKNFGLPMPNISSFHVAGFDLRVDQGPKDIYGRHGPIEVTAVMHVRDQDKDVWTHVQGREVFSLPDDQPARNRTWQTRINSLLTQLLLHELDESLFFDGKHHRNPHPELLNNQFFDYQALDKLESKKGQQL